MGAARGLMVCWRIPGVCVLLGVALAAAPARAGGIKDADLSLRLPAALTRFAPYADVAAVGGASAASKWSSSVNPASVAWQPIPGTLHLSFSPQYADILFREGTELHIASEAVTLDTGCAGTLQPALAQVWSNRATTRQGLDFGIDMDFAQVQWATRISNDWAVGANFNYAKSHTQFDLLDMPVSDSHSDAYGWRFGVLRRLTDRLLAGIVGDYGFSRDRTVVHDFLGLGVGDIGISDTTHQFAVRPGVSYEYAKDSAVYADYQFAAFRNDTGRLHVNRFFMGVDHAITKGLFVRGGAALDTCGNASWTTGIGIYPSDRISIDIAYQQNMFPELEREFGRSQTLTVSLGFTF